ncbi:ATP-binding protein [Streptomyces sp. B21-083]|uniref:ATP-binding protein n=1 Tax=Streptomyces sp. B21-083 TaxID=3039410 RepID=UPI002FEF0B52
MAPPSLPQPLGRMPSGRRVGRPDNPDLPDPFGHSPQSDMFVLPAAPASVSAARRKVRELLDAWRVDADTADNALLITSELVTNALTHTASERIVCRLRLAAGRLHVEVEDENRGGTLPAQRRPGFDEQCGRGLLLVGVLSSDWGVRDAPHGSGRIVWAELPTAEVELTETSTASPPSTTSTAPASPATPAEATAPTGTASLAETATATEAALIASAPVGAAASLSAAPPLPPTGRVAAPVPAAPPLPSAAHPAEAPSTAPAPAGPAVVPAALPPASAVHGVGSVSAPASLPAGAHASAPALALPPTPSTLHATPAYPTAHAILAAPAVQVVAPAPWHPSAPHRIRPVPHSAEGIASHGPYGTTAPHPPYSRS